MKEEHMHFSPQLDMFSLNGSTPIKVSVQYWVTLPFTVNFPWFGTNGQGAFVKLHTGHTYSQNFIAWQDFKLHLEVLRVYFHYYQWEGKKKIQGIANREETCKNQKEKKGHK